MTTSMEHRWGQRIPADLAVLVSCDGGMSGMGRVSNVSLSGALLETPLEVPLHAGLTVLPFNWSNASSGICACVVRTQPGGIAIEWRDMASPQVIALIKSISSDSTGLERRDAYAA